MRRKKRRFQVMARNARLFFLVCAYALILLPGVANADNSSSQVEGLRRGNIENASGSIQKKFQFALADAYRSVAAGKSGKKKVLFDVVPDQKYRMNCSPAKVSSQDRKFTISFEDIDVPESFSLVFIDEFQRMLIVAGTDRGAYIDDNAIQPELIKKNSVVTTKPSETYGHMNDTGYPYPAFGPNGAYAILLVDDVISFKSRSINTSRGKVPNVIAGCAVTWTDN